MIDLLILLAATDDGGKDNTFGNVLMVAGVLLLLTIVMYNFRKRLSKTQQIDPRQKIERDRQVNAMKNDLRSMMVELEDVTRQFSAQLDAKSRRLEQLIDQADQRIAALGGERAGPSGPAEDPTDNGSADPPSAAPDADPLTRNVYQLADEGLGAGEIARRLEEHVGKVELILALRQHG